MPEYQNRHSRDYTRQSPYNTDCKTNNNRKTASYTSSSQRPVRNQEASSCRRRNKFSYSEDTSPSYYSKNTTPSYYSGSTAPSYYSGSTAPSYYSGNTTLSYQRRTNAQQKTYQPVTRNSRPVRNSYERQKNYEEEPDKNLQDMQNTSANNPKSKPKTKSKKKKSKKKKVLSTLIISLIVTLCGTSGCLYYQYKANQNKGTTEFVPFSEKLVMPKHNPKDRVVEVTLFDLDGKVYHRYELHKQRADGTYNWDKADKWD